MSQRSSKSLLKQTVKSTKNIVNTNKNGLHIYMVQFQQEVIRNVGDKFHTKLVALKKFQPFYPITRYKV